jgi:glycosyltransferase involved in cell wall biosynthesis
MATYNGAEFINTQMSSILNQLKDDDEVVVVDDASADDTVITIRNMNDPRIKLYINDRNIGPALTFDSALNYACGDLIFLSDQDDRWHEHKVAHLVNIFNTQDVDLVVHDAVVVRNKHIISNSLFKDNRSSSGIFKNIFKNTYTGCCMAFRKGILKKVLPISPNIGLFHDAWIGILSKYHGYRVLFIQTPLIDFIRHDMNASSSKRRSLYLALHDRIYFVISLFKHVLQGYLRKSCDLAREKRIT